MKRVLVVDDVAASRLALQLELSAIGCAVTEAGTGQEAMALLAARPFDAVVTDVWMPGQDGLQVVKAVHEMAEKLPVWVITGGGVGLTLEGVSTLARLWGAEGVLLKPFDAKALAATIAARIA